MPQDPDPKKRSGRKKAKSDSARSAGKSWFLGIGINDYQDFPSLRNAVRDVEEIVELLQERYDVAPENTITLYNKDATRRNIINTLDRLESMIGPQDKLIIYYSGHGHLNKRNGKGYWIPTNAEQDNTAAYIRNSTIREYIETLQTLHTLLISDSCFSGSMFVRGTNRSTAAVNELERIPSRWAMCSGRSDEEVFDGEPGGHSPFAESILDTLKSNQHKELNVAKLVDRVIEQTRSNYQQLPEGNPMYGVGHKGGQYVFRLKADEAENWAAAMETGTLQAFQQFLINHPDGAHAAEAKEKIVLLEEDAAWQSAANKNTISTYIQYRRDYPSGRYRAQAMSAIKELEEDQDWRKAKVRSTISGYESFLEKYPDGKYHKEADIALNALLQKQQPANPSKEEDTLWESVNKKNTVAEYNRYLKQYPNGRFVAQAKDRIEHLNAEVQKARKEKEIEAAWEKVKNSHSIAKLQNFKTLYPRHPYAQKAAKIITVLEQKAKISDIKTPDKKDEQIPKEKPVEKASKTKGFRWKKRYNRPLVIGVSSVLLIWISIQFIFPLFNNASGASNKKTPIQQLEENMVLVKGGTFIMGCQEEHRDEYRCPGKPAHEVTLDDFYIGRYEVTQAQWREVMGIDPPELHNKGCDECPVEMVSWNDIQDFLQQLNKLTGQNYRLPTEAEWEFAARGGNQSQGYLYSGSNNIDEVAWYDKNYRENNNYGEKQTTRPVGQKKANELGLFDMSGNVEEWCQDRSGDYPSAAQQNPKGPESGGNRVLRGGHWDGHFGLCSAADRSLSFHGARYDRFGFRLALSSR